MKRVLLLIVVPALLVALGFAQTPAANSNTDQTNIKGCLGGSDGNYTVAEDNTGQIFKITTSGVDLKPHLGHDVKLVGHKASGAVGSDAANNSFAVTELSMISEHCASAAAAPSATGSTSSATVDTPAAAATTPAATVSTPAIAPAATVSTADAPAAVPAATVSAPDVAAVAPAATVGTPAAAPAATVIASTETVSTPVAVPATPSASVSTPSEATGTAAAASTHPTRAAARPRKQSATAATAAATAAAIPAATDSTSTKDAGATASAGTPPSATGSRTTEADSTPAAAATTPAATAKGGFPLWLGISLGVLVLVLGASAPFLNRWRKRRMLERTDAPNLSFNREASSAQDKIEKPVPRKAA